MKSLFDKMFLLKSLYWRQKYLTFLYDFIFDEQNMFITSAVGDHYH